jgi:hypothetical protein
MVIGNNARCKGHVHIAFATTKNKYKHAIVVVYNNLLTSVSDVNFSNFYTYFTFEQIYHCYIV